jgi:GT2 family glycosyltransferase
MSRDVSIIIPNWNGGKMLVDCIDSILANTSSVDYELILVDNGSDDGSAAIVEKYTRAHSHVHGIYNHTNLCFSRACNQGYAVSSGRYVIIGNNDILLRENVVRRLCEFADANPAAGVVSPRFIGPDGVLQRLCRRFPRAWYILATYHPLGRAIDKLLLAGVLRRRYLYADRSFHKVELIDQAGASFSLFRCTTIDAAGGLFQEQFSLFFNDVDLCKRIRRQGYLIYMLPECEVMHKGSVASHQLDDRIYMDLFFEGMWSYFRQYHSFDYALLSLAWPNRSQFRRGWVGPRS